MMKFEYNSDCKFDDRILLVANEITSEYPEISMDEAKKIAAFDNPIDDKLINDDKFIRYYMILLAIKKNHPVYFKVFNDAVNVFNDGISDVALIWAMEEIKKYNSGERLDFPILSEFYN